MTNTHWIGLALNTQLYWLWRTDATAFMLACWKLRRAILRGGA